MDDYFVSGELVLARSSGMDQFLLKYPWNVASTQKSTGLFGTSSIRSKTNADILPNSIHSCRTVRVSNSKSRCGWNECILRSFCIWILFLADLRTFEQVACTAHEQ